MFWGYDSHVGVYKALKVEEAKDIAKGLQLTTIRQRTFYEDSWTETAIDWDQIVELIERVRNEVR